MDTGGLGRLLSKLRSKRTGSVQHAWPQTLTSRYMGTASSCRSSSMRGTVRAARLLPTVTSSHSSRKPKRPCQSSCRRTGRRRRNMPGKSLVPSHDHPRIAARVAAVARRTRVSAPTSRPRRTRGLDESELLHLRPLRPSGLDKVDRRFTCGRSIGGVRDHRSITRSFCRIDPHCPARMQCSITATVQPHGQTRPPAAIHSAASGSARMAGWYRSDVCDRTSTRMPSRARSRSIE